MVLDQRMGWPYYVEHDTGKSTWDDRRLIPKFRDFDGFRQHMKAPKVYEIPVHHGNAKQQPHLSQVQTPWAATPPQVGATPKTETSRVYTLPQKHINKNFTNQSVREIPIQHVYSRIPSKRCSSQIECPQQDYPGAPCHVQQLYQHPQEAAKCSHPQQQSFPISQLLGHCKQSSHAPHPENEAVFNIPTLKKLAKMCPEEAQNFQSPQAAESTSLQDDQTNKDLFNQNNTNMNYTCSGLDQTNNIEADDLREDPSVNEDLTVDQEKQRNISMQMITDILTECETYKDKVSSFNGTKQDKEYKFLEETLTLCILKLDNVDSGYDADVRNARKRAVLEIQSSLDQLEQKAVLNAEVVPCQLQANAEVMPCQLQANAEVMPCQLQANAEVMPCQLQANAEVVPCQLQANAAEMNQELLDTSSQFECQENKDSESIKEMMVDGDVAC